MNLDDRLAAAFGAKEAELAARAPSSDAIADSDALGPRIEVRTNPAPAVSRRSRGWPAVVALAAAALTVAGLAVFATRANDPIEPTEVATQTDTPGDGTSAPAAQVEAEPTAESFAIVGDAEESNCPLLAGSSTVLDLDGDGIDEMITSAATGSIRTEFHRATFGPDGQDCRWELALRVQKSVPRSVASCHQRVIFGCWNGRPRRFE